jgi:quercetin 2,3-dioxygenase
MDDLFPDLLNDNAILKTNSMKLQEKAAAQIYLAGFRKEEATSSFRSLYSEMKGEQHAVVIKETCLAAHATFSSPVASGHLRVIFPLAGSLQLTQDNEFYSLVPGGSAALTQSYEIRNPYPKNEIHFLEIDFACDFQKPEPHLFDLNSRNTLQPLIPLDDSAKLLIGKFDGRVDGFLSLYKEAEVFVFIIGGVFEVANRLLQEREGLWLNRAYELEFEGLAKEGIILILTQPIK